MAARPRRWRVDLIRKRAEHLGIIEAADAETAIAVAAERFEIEPARRNRLVVTEIPETKKAPPG